MASWTLKDLLESYDENIFFTLQTTLEYEYDV